MKTKKIIVGISGASGVSFGILLLKILRELDVETHLTISKAGALTISQETDHTVKEVIGLSSFFYSHQDFTAAIASGSFLTDGMIVAPSSVRTFSEIATGACSNLLTRAADVTLKEKRRLLLMVRETPLHEGHLESLAKLSRLGAIVFPPVPAFYLKPKSIEQMQQDLLTKVLDYFHLTSPHSRRWGS